MDVRSQVSQARSVAASSRRGGFPEMGPGDIDQHIVNSNHGKVIGMTSAQWSEQVAKNVNDWQQQTREKAQLLH